MNILRQAAIASEYDAGDSVTLKVHEELCVACGVCLQVCPLSGFAPNLDPFPVLNNPPEICPNCYFCVDMCPTMALELLYDGSNHTIFYYAFAPDGTILTAVKMTVFKRTSNLYLLKYSIATIINIDDETLIEDLLYNVTYAPSDVQFLLNKFYGSWLGEVVGELFIPAIELSMNSYSPMTIQHARRLGGVTDFIWDSVVDTIRINTFYGSLPSSGAFFGVSLVLSGSNNLNIFLTLVTTVIILIWGK
jgi:ferredoxin